MNLNFIVGNIQFDELGHLLSGDDLQDNLDGLKEDMFQVDYFGRFLLDIGWYPSFDEGGCFQVRVIKDFDWGNPVFLKSSATLTELVAVAVTAQEVIMDLNKNLKVHWIKDIDGGMAWRSIFGESLPKETKIDMAVLRGNTILIRAFGPLEGMLYPDKWDRNGFNSFEFEICIQGVDAICAKNYCLFGGFAISGSLPDITIETEGGCLFKCQAQGLSILNIHGFYDEQA